jgi:hypothetical protein
MRVYTMLYFHADNLCTPTIWQYLSQSHLTSCLQQDGQDKKDIFAAFSSRFFLEHPAYLVCKSDEKKSRLRKIIPV